MENKIISVVSGGFDPIHPGHIMMMKECLEFSNFLIVGVNSNKWLIDKKGNFFMDIQHRMYVVDSLKVVNEAMEFEDDEMGSANNLLIQVRNKYPNEKIIFANGGDRSIKNIPEMTEEGVQFLFGIGGNFKKNSSSSILNKWVDFIQKNKG